MNKSVIIHIGKCVIAGMCISVLTEENSQYIRIKQSKKSNIIMQIPLDNIDYLLIADGTQYKGLEDIKAYLKKEGHNKYGSN